MDLRQVEVNETCTFQLKDGMGNLIFAIEGKGKSKKKLPATVTVHGPGSEKYVAAQAKRNQRVLGRVRDKGEQEDTTLQDNAEFLADITECFDNVEFDGLSDREMALAIYLEPKVGFIADQVLLKTSNWAAFMKGSTET